MVHVHALISQLFSSPRRCDARRDMCAKRLMKLPSSTAIANSYHPRHYLSPTDETGVYMKQVFKKNKNYVLSYTFDVCSYIVYSRLMRFLEKKLIVFLYEIGYCNFDKVKCI